MQNLFPWQKEPPKNDGDYFYSGPTPDGKEIVVIVQIVTDPKGQRFACCLIPPFWRGDTTRINSTVHFGEIEKWKGEWSGPELGLCCATA